MIDKEEETCLKSIIDFTVALGGDVALVVGKNLHTSPCKDAVVGHSGLSKSVMLESIHPPYAHVFRLCPAVVCAEV